MCGLDSSGSGQVPVAGSYEHDIELSVSIKGEEFLDQLSKYQFFKKDPDLWSYLFCTFQGLGPLACKR
jgi:hypothetical protein